MSAAGAEICWPRGIGRRTINPAPRHRSIFLQDCMNILNRADHYNQQRSRHAEEEHPLQGRSEQVHDCVHIA